MRPDLRLATKLAADLLALTAAIAATVHLLAAERAREWLDFGFAGVPHTVGTAASIFGNNARILAGILAASVAVQVGRAAAGTRATRIFAALIASICDGGLIVACSLQVIVIGAAYGAYGFRTVEATAAHGPFELAAYSVALALYLSARCEPLGWPRFARISVAASALLVVGALLEAFV
jgi:hypothetical protein